MNLIYADPDPEDGEFFKDVIHEIDPSFTCTVVHSGLEALNILNESIELPDYIFLDETTRLLNGEPCLQVIKSIPRLQHIPTIMCFSIPVMTRMEEYIKLGAEYCYIKPSNFAD